MEEVVDSHERGWKKNTVGGKKEKKTVSDSQGCLEKKRLRPGRGKREKHLVN